MLVTSIPAHNERTGCGAAFDAVIRGRRTVRAFLPDCVPRHVLEDLVSLAGRAPSTFNTQPWRLHVLAGEARQALTDAVLAAHAAQAEPAFTPFPNPVPPACEALQAAFGAQYYATLGIHRADEAARARQTARNFAFFGAPVGLLCSTDARLTCHSWLDLGLFLQTFMLAAQDRGLGTCPQVSFVRYQRVIAAHLGWSAHERLACAMSLGYPDPAAAVNRMGMQRRPLADFTEWHGF